MDDQELFVGNELSETDRHALAVLTPRVIDGHERPAKKSKVLAAQCGHQEAKRKIYRSAARLFRSTRAHMSAVSICFRGRHSAVLLAEWKYASDEDRPRELAGLNERV